MQFYPRHPRLQVLFEMLDGLEQQTRPIMEACGCPGHPACTHFTGSPNAARCFALDRLSCALPPLAAARKALAEEKGEVALRPYNTGYSLAGDVEKVRSGAGAARVRCGLAGGMGPP